MVGKEVKLARGKNGRLRPFVAMLWDLLNSHAYKGLSYPAAKILPYFLGRPHRPQTHPDYYQIEFQFSYPEAEKLGFAKSTFAKCILELQAAGFIRKTRHGGLRGNRKGYNWFTLSSQWESDGAVGSIAIGKRVKPP